MKHKKILIFGASGFIGTNLLKALLRQGHLVTAIGRSKTGLEKLKPFSLRTALCDHTNREKLKPFFKEQDVVINLIGILNETPMEKFKDVHQDIPLRLLDLCRSEGVDQYIHMSALPANGDHSPSRYLRSRGLGEEMVHENSGSVSVSSIRPSVVFGPGDHFFSNFNSFLRWMPVFPLPCPSTLFAPVFVGDVVGAIMRIVLEPNRFEGHRFDLCGPEIYTFRELIELLVVAGKHNCQIVNLPNWAARLQALVLGPIPPRIFTTDNYLSLQVDNVSDHNGLLNLGITPHSINASPLVTG
ncbi:MAG: epimerase [Acidiferrobacteraceae bacterium]|nr:epimerase [Acidiferrobacteraceae bacterium]|tara:strand:- start:4029 stop:4925 length:897 start_codon:yes stop_codon:yes gene_type:complete